MNEAIAKFKLMGLQSTVSKSSDMDMVIFFTNAGVPQEVVTRLQALWNSTKKIAGAIYDIGKIIVSKIIEFIKKYPNFSIALLIVVSASILITSLPFLSSLLSPLLSSAEAGFIAVLGGFKMDSTSKHSSEIDSIIEMAKEFFNLFVEIFESLKDYFKGENIDG